MTNKLLHLSVVVELLNEEGEKRVKKAMSRVNLPKEDRHGRTLENYEDLAMKPPNPEDFEEEEIETDEDGKIIVEQHEVDYDGASCSLPLKNIDSWVEHNELGSVVYMKSGVFFHVWETSDEINDYYEYLSLSWLSKKYLTFKVFLIEKFGKKKNN